MVKEHSVHGFTDIIVTTERERKVTYSPADMRSGKVFLNPTGSFDEVHRIVVMLFDTRSYGKHIRIENNIVRVKTYFINQKTISTLANFYFTRSSVSLSFFIKSHYYGRSSVLLDNPGVFKEFVFAFFQRNRVNDRFPLKAF